MKKSTTYFIGGVTLCLVGAVCFSTKAILVKLAYKETSVDAVSLLALRMLFSLPFFLISAFLFSRRQDNIRFTGKEWMAVAVLGCLGYYVSSLLDFIGLQYISAGIERLVLFIYPTMVLLMSAIVFRTKVKKIQWIAVLVTYSGLFLAFLGEASYRSSRPEHLYLGSSLIFLCSMTYAAYIVGSGKLIPKLGAAKFNSYAMSFAAISVVIHFLVTSDQNLFQLSTRVYVYSLLMAIVSTVIPSFLISEGIRRIGSDNTAIVSSIGPVSTIIQASIILSEPVSVPQIVGTVFILLGVLLIGWKGNRAIEEPVIGGK